MEDFTSKKTQIVSGAPVIKKVFRMRDGGVVVTSFDSTKSINTIHYGTIPAGTLLIIDYEGTIKPCPITSDGHWDVKAGMYLLGFTVNDVTPDKPQASVMTWGVINFDAYESEFGGPWKFGSDFYDVLLREGIYVTFEPDVIPIPERGSE